MAVTAIFVSKKDIQHTRLRSIIHFMRSSRLVFLGIALSLFAVAAFADSIDSVTPSSFFVNDAEVQITINGSGLQGNIESIVNFDGPGGHFIAATDAGASTFLVVSVPPGVLATAGHYLVSVDAVDDTGTRHITGGALDIVNRPVGPPQIFVPDPIAAEATSSSGAVVTFTVVAINGDGSPAPFVCNHQSGDTYPLGVTAVTCDVTDNLGNILRDGFGQPVAEGTFDIFVNDTVPPVLTLPGRIISTDPVVTFTVTAVDGFDGPLPVTCDPASGSTFPAGNTTVVCTAIDSHANRATGSFVVFVGSEPPPSLTLPADITVSTSAAFGTTVTFTAMTDPGVSLDCVPPSGSFFLYGTTVVQCTATKSATSSTTGTFNITVVKILDVTPPVLTLPADITAEATSPAGAVVSYSASAVDDVDGPVVVNCTPVPGSTFPLGTTTVQCSAQDAAGNVAHGSFHVNVVDTTPPHVTSITANPATLWPPNHKMNAITVTVVATDIVDQNPTSTIVSVTSDQPINGNGDGNTEPDWEITGPLTVNLRAERTQGVDRVYTITVVTSDFSGNTTTSTVTVRVTQQKSRGVGH
jgi:hypothetical protein